MKSVVFGITQIAKESAMGLMINYLSQSIIIIWKAQEVPQ